MARHVSASMKPCSVLTSSGRQKPRYIQIIAIAASGPAACLLTPLAARGRGDVLTVAPAHIRHDRMIARCRFCYCFATFLRVKYASGVSDVPQMNEAPMADQPLHTVDWIDHGREPRCLPDPVYPEGKDVDATNNRKPACKVTLPYPALRCGAYIIECRSCGLRASLTTAGRPDDPRSVRLPCKRLREN